MTSDTLANVVEFKTADGRPVAAPHNVEAEQALLGAIFINNEAYWRVSDQVAAADFYEPVHQQIFEVIHTIVRAGRAATPVTVKSYLPAALTPEMTMPVYLARLAASAASVINAVDFARVVRELALRRALSEHARELAEDALHPRADESAGDLIDGAERRLFAIAESGGGTSGFLPFNEALKEAIAMAGEAYSRDGGLSGLATGFIDVDRLMGGLQKSDLVILAARPAMGKTSLATNIAYRAARAWRGEITPAGQRKTLDGAAVGFFSLEMSAEQLATRILAEQAEISSSDIRRGNIHESQFSRLVDVSNALSTLPLYIDDTGGLSVAQLATRARRLKRQKGLDLVVVDYLQLLSGEGRRSDNRVNEITQITTGLKTLAKELEVPILALSQLSRQVENREDKRPQLSDLRESGSIEQDADVVLFIYREEYYLGMKEPAEGTPEHLAWLEKMEAAHGRAELIIGKQRHGPTGTVTLSFEAQFTRFGDFADPARLPPHGGWGGGTM